MMASITTRRTYSLAIRGRQEILGSRTWIMGILNVTPDSFSDGGAYPDVDAAVSRGMALFEAGADVVDVGGESTRPGSAPVDSSVERSRVAPVIEGLRERGAGFVSVDTTKALVAGAALDAGADMVNDVSGFRFDAAMAPLVASRRVPVAVMHLRGDFATMHQEPRYGQVMEEVIVELRESLAGGASAGISPGQMIVDPGIGFAKNRSHSLAVLRDLPAMQALDRPVLVGPSRKSFIGKLLELPAGERLMGTAAAVAASILGGAHIVRVHDVGEMVQVARVCDAILGVP
jgi:dihydropteroate synthase